MASGDEDDYTQDLLGKDITEIKEEVTILLAERDRRQETKERLQEKLKVINYELAARKEEKDRQQSLLTEETRKKQASQNKQSSSQALVVTDDDDREHVRKFAAEQLDKHAPERKEKNELGIQTFDERHLMVARRMPDEKKDTRDPTRDTVLIEHFRKWDSEDASDRYFLSYRVGRNTTCRTLREDACLYWGISEVEYVIWTAHPIMAKVQDDTPVNSCFKKNEEAKFILAPKTVKKTDVTDTVAEKIRPKQGPNKATKKKVPKASQNSEDSAAGITGGADFFKEMSKVSGLWEFMTRRDKVVTKHMDRIRCSDYFCYSILALITLFMFYYYINPPGMEYNTQIGMYNALVLAGPQNFEKIRTKDEAWRWLEHSAGAQLWDEASELRRSNYLPGWLRIRMQRVKPANNTLCTEDHPAEILCTAAAYHDLTEEKGDLEDIKTFWQNKSGVDGRSSTIEPWRWVPGENMSQVSGYFLDYNLQFENMSIAYQAYLQDLDGLESRGWIGEETRNIHLSFTMYNANHDYWSSNWYHMQMPPNGVVSTMAEVDLFRTIYDAGFIPAAPVMSLDGLRALIVLYIAFSVLYFQARQRPKWWTYFSRPKGIADLGIFGFYWANTCLRLLNMGYKGKAEMVTQELMGRYYETWVFGYVYRTTRILDACFFGCLVFRIACFMKFNRKVYILWATLSMVGQKCYRYSLFFAPVLISIVVVSHIIWANSEKTYKNLISSTASVFTILQGDSAPLTPGTARRLWTEVFQIVLYVVFDLLVVNTWIAMMVNEYQKVRAVSGYRPKKYDWHEHDWARWCLHAKLLYWWVWIRRKVYPYTDIEPMSVKNEREKHGDS